MTKNIQNSTGRNDTIIRESLSGPSISVISKGDNIRRRLQRAVKETGLLNSQDIDRWCKTALTRKARRWWLTTPRKGSIPKRLANQAKTEKQKYIKQIKVFEVVDRKEASGSKVIRTRWVVTNTRTPEKPNVRARWVAQEFKWTAHAAADGRNKDHVVAVVDVRRAYFYA